MQAYLLYEPTVPYTYVLNTQHNDYPRICNRRAPFLVQDYKQDERSLRLVNNKTGSEHVRETVSIPARALKSPSTQYIRKYRKPTIPLPPQVRPQVRSLK